mmetsp:Transcript_21506/g.52309  ORF Transcript_21506/g.52309 Transcript_21506/m.52309 type:complete len:227 (+) Transcript_21506:1052-1732(+)
MQHFSMSWHDRPPTAEQVFFGVRGFTRPHFAPSPQPRTVDKRSSPYLGEPFDEFNRFAVRRCTPKRPVGEQVARLRRQNAALRASEQRQRERCVRTLAERDEEATRAAQLEEQLQAARSEVKFLRRGGVEVSNAAVQTNARAVPGKALAQPRSEELRDCGHSGSRQKSSVERCHSAPLVRRAPQAGHRPTLGAGGSFGIGCEWLQRSDWRPFFAAAAEQGIRAHAD